MSFFNRAAEELGLDEVKLNDEVRRIERLPRRSMWDIADQLVDELTELLKTEQGTMTLRPVQAISLYEIGEVGGLFGALRVGAGKTLISMLAPEVAFSDRPLLLIPASLRQKTDRDRRVLEWHWQIPSFYRVMSYEWLGRVQAAEALEAYQPDLIVADEAHRLKNPRAACTRRVRRYMNAHPLTKFVAMSGTITKRSLLDYAHILRWCLKAGDAPIPQWYQDLELWADALDERKGQIKRAKPGALRVFCNEEELKLWDAGDDRRAARLGFKRRLIDTPGIVATKETPIDASLVLTAVEPKVSKEIDQAFATLRARFKTPDGWPIADGLGMFRHARELALGFYYVWAPRPPKYWLTARTEWFAYVRKVLKHSRKLDSELMVRRAVRATKPEEGLELLEEWEEVKNDFEPNTVARWIDDSVVEACAEWAKSNAGIVWTEHRCFAEKLSEISGLPYYGRKGLDERGRFIEDHPPGKPMIASIHSNATGRNLQAWSRALITSMPPNGLQNEQLLGRLHRDGQEADEVRFDVLVTCPEHVGAFWQAVADSRYVQDSFGSPQKMLDADVMVPRPEDIVFRRGHRWAKTI